MNIAARHILTMLLLPLFGSGQLVAGCGTESTTRIVVQVNADDDVITRAKNVQLAIAARGANDDAFEVVKEFTVPAPVDASRWPLQHVLEPRGGDATRIYRVSVRALDANQKMVISQAGASSGYVASQTRTLRIHLPGGSCLNTECSLGEACMRGVCGPIPFVEATALPRPGMERDPGGGQGSKDAAVNPRSDGSQTAPGDAAIDARGDAATDAGKPCQQDACDVPSDGCSVGRWDCSGETPACVATGAHRMGRLCTLAGCEVGTECTGICDGDGQCKDAGCGVACTPPGGNPCKVYKVACTADGKDCVEVGHQEAGVPCGESTSTECDKPDACDGAGVCKTNVVAKGTACGDRLSTNCTQPDECDGNGVCDGLHLLDNTACDKLHCRTGEKCTAGQCGGGNMVQCPTTESSTCRIGTCTEAAEGCTHTTKTGYCYWHADNSCHMSGATAPGGCQRCSPPNWFPSCVGM